MVKTINSTRFSLCKFDISHYLEYNMNINILYYIISYNIRKKIKGAIYCTIVRYVETKLMFII